MMGDVYLMMMMMMMVEVQAWSPLLTSEHKQIFP